MRGSPKDVHPSLGRRVNAGDATRLAELFAGIRDPHFHPHPLTAAEADRISAYEGRDIYAVLEDPGGRLVAYGLLRGWDEGYTIPSLGVAVHRDSRGLGYGRSMMDWLANEARRQGADRIRLRVHPDNESARRLYESLGYVSSAEERGEIVMILALARI